QAYRRRPGNLYEAQALPPLRFDYSRFRPLEQGFQPLDGEFGYQPLTIERAAPLGLPLGGGGFQLVDLNEEGLPGLLYDRRGVALYWQPCGDGDFARPAAPESFPIEGAGDPDYDLGDGSVTRLTVRSGGRAGTYRMVAKGKWSGFQPLDSVPLEFERGGVELEDVTGDG